MLEKTRSLVLEYKLLLQEKKKMMLLLLLLLQITIAAAGAISVFLSYQTSVASHLSHYWYTGREGSIGLTLAAVLTTVIIITTISI